MSYAELAKEVGYKFEAKKDAFKQNQDGTVKITLSVHPDEVPWQLMKDAMGQRFVCVIVPIDEEEKPRLAPAASTSKDASVAPPVAQAQAGDKPKQYTAAAKLLAQNVAFRRYAAQEWPGIAVLDLTMAEEHIEQYCGVTSCKDIKDGTEAGKKFARLYAEFQDWQRFA